MSADILYLKRALQIERKKNKELQEECTLLAAMIQRKHFKNLCEGQYANQVRRKNMPNPHRKTKADKNKQEGGEPATISLKRATPEDSHNPDRLASEHGTKRLRVDESNMQEESPQVPKATGPPKKFSTRAEQIEQEIAIAKQRLLLKKKKMLQNAVKLEAHDPARDVPPIGESHREPTAESAALEILEDKSGPRNADNDRTGKGKQ